MSCRFVNTTLSKISINEKGEYGIGASAVPFDAALPKYLRISDITDDSSLSYADVKSINEDKFHNYLLKQNDIVFARTGNSTGRNYFFEGNEGNYVYAGFLIKFSLDPNKVNPRYVKYYCMSIDY